MSASNLQQSSCTVALSLLCFVEFYAFDFWLPHPTDLLPPNTVVSQLRISNYWVSPVCPSPPAPCNLNPGWSFSIGGIKSYVGTGTWACRVIISLTAERSSAISRACCWHTPNRRCASSLEIRGPELEVLWDMDTTTQIDSNNDPKPKCSNSCYYRRFRWIKGGLRLELHRAGTRLSTRSRRRFSRERSEEQNEESWRKKRDFEEWRQHKIKASCLASRLILTTQLRTGLAKRSIMESLTRVHYIRPSLKRFSPWICCLQLTQRVNRSIWQFDAMIP